jgi:hypothetical protein
MDAKPSSSSGAPGCYDEANVFPFDTVVDAKAGQQLCTDANLQVYTAACWTAATKSKAACDAFGLANPACLACILPSDTDTVLSVLLPLNARDVMLNAAACLALKVGCTSADAVLYGKQAHCGASTCVGCATEADNTGCTSHTYRRGACSSIRPSAACASLLRDPAKAKAAEDACFGVMPVTEATALQAVAKVLCGAP